MVVYIMDLEVVPCSPNMFDWPLNLYWAHFGLHQEERCKSAHET